MVIKKSEVSGILKNMKIRYGLRESNPVKIDSDYKLVDVFSDRLPINTSKEYEIAAKVAKECNLDLLYQDFGLGEGSQHSFEYVFATTCTTTDALRNASKKVDSGIIKLREELEK